jgi:hypothetical protein
MAQELSGSYSFFHCKTTSRAHLQSNKGGRFTSIERPLLLVFSTVFRSTNSPHREVLVRHLVLASVVFCFMAFAVSVSAEIPKMINYQAAGSLNGRAEQCQ